MFNESQAANCSTTKLAKLSTEYWVRRPQALGRYDVDYTDWLCGYTAICDCDYTVQYTTLQCLRVYDSTNLRLESTATKNSRSLRVPHSTLSTII